MLHSKAQHSNNGSIATKHFLPEATTSSGNHSPPTTFTTQHGEKCLNVVEIAIISGTK